MHPRACEFVMTDNSMAECNAPRWRSRPKEGYVASTTAVRLRPDDVVGETSHSYRQGAQNDTRWVLFCFDHHTGSRNVREQLH
jgi:hypothetical protein